MIYDVKYFCFQIVYKVLAQMWFEKALMQKKKKAWFSFTEINRNSFNYHDIRGNNLLPVKDDLLD